MSFSKNKRDLFEERAAANYNQKFKQKQSSRTEVKEENDDYSNFLKHKEIISSSQDGFNPSSLSFKKKSRSDKMREGSTKRHKTPTHIDCGEHSDLKIVLAQDPKMRNQERQNSRNDFTVYTSNTGGPSLHRDDFAKDMLNQMKVKDYVQMNKFDHHNIGACSVTNKKTLDKLSSDDGSYNLQNDLNDFNFYTPNNQQNLIKNSSTNKMYIANKHPLSGSAGYSRGFDNDPSLSFRKKSKSRIDDPTAAGYSSRLNT